MQTHTPEEDGACVGTLGVVSSVIMQRFSIVSATIADCRACVQLFVNQLTEHGVDASAERLAVVLERVVADKARGFLLLAQEDGQTVGFAYAATILSVEHCGWVAWLEELYVMPDQRCHGIGTALVSAVLEHAREAGIVAVDLEIDASHSRAESLYRRFGFSPLQRSRWVRELTPPR